MRVYLPECEYLSGALLLRELTVSIRFQVLGALSKFKGEPHVAAGLGGFLGDPGHIHLSGLGARGQTAVWK